MIEDEGLGLRRMRRIATGLLVAMAVVFIVARAHEGAHPAVGYVRAFAEAAMIGALADWFAVVALFRHPLGLPIPHTAIIPRNKDRIGLGLARFVETNFLAPRVVAQKLDTLDLAGSLAAWLMADRNIDALSGRVARFLPSLLDALDDDDLRDLIQVAIAGKLERLRLAPLAGETLMLLTRDGRHVPLVDQLLRNAGTLLERYEPQIRAKVRERSNWFWRVVGADVIVCDKLIAAAQESLAAAQDDPQHEWRLQLDAQLSEFAKRLKTSPELEAGAQALKDELLNHPAVVAYLRGLWQELRDYVAKDVTGPDSAIRAHIASALDAFAQRLQHDDAVRRKLNRLLRSAVEQAAEAGRHNIVDLIASTVAKWDAQTVGRKIELAVGRDLQFVRINGTVIGGLVGVILHAVGGLLPG